MKKSTYGIFVIIALNITLFFLPGCKRAQDLFSAPQNPIQPSEPQDTQQPEESSSTSNLPASQNSVDWDEEWDLVLGGSGNDFCSDIILSDIIFLTGQTHSLSAFPNYHSQYDGWAAMLSQEGDVIWSTCLGGSEHDFIFGSTPTYNEDYILYGYTMSNNGDCVGNHGSLFNGHSDYISNIKDVNWSIEDWKGIPATDGWVVKIDKEGETLWSKCLGGSGEERIYSAIETEEGNILCVGGTSSMDGDVTGYHPGGFIETGTRLPCSDTWVCLLSDEGEIIWEKALGGMLQDELVDFCIVDNNIYIVANTFSYDGDLKGIAHNNAQSQRGDIWFLCLSLDGELQFKKVFGGLGTDKATKVVFNDKEIYVTGTTTSLSGNVENWHEAYDVYGNPIPDIWTIKISYEGDLLWSHCLGGTGNDYPTGFAFLQDSVIVLGNSNSKDGDVLRSYGDTDILFTSYNTEGQLISINVFGGSKREEATKIIDIKDKYLILSSTSSDNGDVTANHGETDMWIFEVDLNGQILRDTSLGGSKGDSFTGVALKDNHIIITGYTYSEDIKGSRGPTGDGADIWIIYKNINSIFDK